MDPACETCAAFAPFIKQFMAANPGKIKLVMRYAPFHEGADDFVKILEAARMQGKYWETLDVMFKSQSIWASHGNWQPEKLWGILPRAGVDIEQIKQLKARYALACDNDYEPDTLADLFAEDAVWDGGFMGRAEGREPRRRHRTATSYGSHPG